MITISELDQASTLLDTDQIMITHSNGNSEKLPGTIINEKQPKELSTGVTINGTEYTNLQNLLSAIGLNVYNTFNNKTNNTEYSRYYPLLNMYSTRSIDTSCFLLSLRGGETWLLMLGTTDAVAKLSPILICLNPASRKLEELYYNTSTGELTVKVGKYSYINIIQISGNKVNFSIGDIQTQTSLVNTATKLNIVTDVKVPNPPSSNGTYVLECTVASGTPTYSWVAQS